MNLLNISIKFSHKIKQFFNYLNLIFLVVSLVVVSLGVITAMTVTAIRLDLDGMGVDDVIDFLVAGRFVVVTDVVSVQVALGVVTLAGLVLAVIGVVIIVLHAPVKVVVRCVLK